MLKKYLKDYIETVVTKYYQSAETLSLQWCRTKMWYDIY